MCALAASLIAGAALRPAAREMIVAQQMAGGAPAQEMTARVFTKNG